MYAYKDNCDLNILCPLYTLYVKENEKYLPSRRVLASIFMAEWRFEPELSRFKSNTKTTTPSWLSSVVDNVKTYRGEVASF